MVVPARQIGTAEEIWQAVNALRDGGVLAVPTDTVYGLICLYDCEPAIRRIFEMKGRPASNPLPVLMGSAAELPLVCREVPQQAWGLIGEFWPGPLTIVLPAHPSLSPMITAGTGTVGVRVPKNQRLLEILETAALPVASTSANLSGTPPAEQQEDLGVMADLVDLVVPRDSSAGVPSTVVDLTTSPVLIRRRGSVSVERVRQVMGTRVDIAAGV